MFFPLKLFGTGQITLPKSWRDKQATKNFIATETPQGLLIKPLTEVQYYQYDDSHFGLHFPLGISADQLAEELTKANGQIP